MSLVRPVVGLLIAVAVTLAAGLIHGRLTSRWGVSTSLQELGTTLEKRLPDTIGSWRLKERLEMDEEAVRMLQCTGKAVRAYENIESGQSVLLIMIVGPMGPTAEHTPEVCFPSRTFRQLGERNRVTIEGPTATEKSEPGDQFWMATYESLSVEGGYVRAYWAWTTGGYWKAVDNPRVQYLAKPYLYKIQVQSQLISAPSGSDADPCRSFLAEFLPVARQAFAGVESASSRN